MKLILGVNFINIYARVFCTKFWRQSRNITRKAAKKDVLYEKFVRLTLMKLTLGVNFTNILRAAFWYESVLLSFSLLWQTNIVAKATLKMLVKLTTLVTTIVTTVTTTTTVTITVTTYFRRFPGLASM